MDILSREMTLSNPDFNRFHWAALLKIDWLGPAAVEMVRCDQTQPNSNIELKKKKREREKI